MNYHPGATRYGRFFTRNAATGVLSNADTTPTVTVYRNGSAVAPSVTVGNASTGEYAYSYTVDAGYETGDSVNEVITAVVSGVTGKKEREYAIAPTTIYGPIGVTITFHDAGAVAVPNVSYIIVGVGSAQSNVSGVSQIGLPDGTYTIRAAPTAQVLFADAELVVSGTTTKTVTGTARQITPPSDPSFVIGVLTAYNGRNEGIQGVRFDFRIVEDIDEEGTSYPRDYFTEISGDDGIVATTGEDGVKHRPSTDYQARRCPDGPWVPYTTPDSGTFNLTSLIGRLDP